MFGAHMCTHTHKPTRPAPYQDHDVLLGTKVRGGAAHGELVTQILVDTDSSAKVGGHDDTYKRTVLQHTYVGGLQPGRAVESFLCCADDGAPPDLVYCTSGMAGHVTSPLAWIYIFCKNESTAETTREEA